MALPVLVSMIHSPASIIYKTGCKSFKCELKQSIFSLFKMAINRSDRDHNWLWAPVRSHNDKPWIHIPLFPIQHQSLNLTWKTYYLNTAYSEPSSPLRTAHMPEVQFWLFKGNHYLDASFCNYLVLNSSLTSPGWIALRPQYSMNNVCPSYHQ